MPRRAHHKLGGRTAHSYSSIISGTGMRPEPRSPKEKLLLPKHLAFAHGLAKVLTAGSLGEADAVDDLVHVGVAEGARLARVDVEDEPERAAAGHR
ncbi:hypothetical protein Airi02_002470 [Actinoallomurus iriomotensis]|uniref:Uncharacterized protein n=1 Tax=Actinoallomurus iriomotensis TaxID=478107 RepID=A0A9W6RYR4_9ACTN|nr:hypothetical protein Airi02_002470 [Actinoallomurus iriomotensis]